jgi:hypothetical protein
VQINGPAIVVGGVTEERALEIAKRTSRAVIEQYTSEAAKTAQERIALLDQRIVERLVSLDRLDTLADPGFQRFLARSQQGAAVSDTPADIDTLVGLLEFRATEGGDRVTRTSIDQASEMVDRIDGAALAAITAIHLLTSFGPSSGYLDQGLQAMGDMFSKLLPVALPTGHKWLDHVDSLGAARINEIGSLKKLEEVWAGSRMIGYVSPGIAHDSAAVRQITFGSTGFTLPLVPHELRPERFRVASPAPFLLRSHLLAFPGVSSDEANAFLAELRNDFGFGDVDRGIVGALGERADAHSTRLAELRAWWNSIPYSVSLTDAGSMLARANARRSDKSDFLPPIS